MTRKSGPAQPRMGEFPADGSDRKLSGAQRRFRLLYPGPYSWDRVSRVWRLPAYVERERVQRGKPR